MDAREARLQAVLEEHRAARQQAARVLLADSAPWKHSGQVRRYTAGLPAYEEFRDVDGYARPHLHVPAPADGVPFETWAQRKDRELSEARSRAFQERYEKEQKERQEQEDTEQRKKVQRELSRKKFVSHMEQHEAERRQEHLDTLAKSMRKQKMEEERHKKGSLAYERWLANHHIYHTQDHTHALTPCKPNLRNKGLSFNEWLANLELRPSSAPFTNPAPWVDPAPPTDDMVAEDAAPWPSDSITAKKDGGHIHQQQYNRNTDTRLQRSSSLAVSVRARSQAPPRPAPASGIIGVRMPPSSMPRAPIRGTLKQKLKSKPKTHAPPEQDAYQEPSPPLLWRDRELAERLGAVTVS